MTALQFLLIWFAGVIVLRVYIFVVTETPGCAVRFSIEYDLYTDGLLSEAPFRFIGVVLWPIFLPVRILYLTVELIAGMLFRFIFGLSRDAEKEPYRRQ